MLLTLLIVSNARDLHNVILKLTTDICTQLLDEKKIIELYKIYKVDFDMFGYTLEGYLPKANASFDTTSVV